MLIISELWVPSSHVSHFFTLYGLVDMSRTMPGYVGKLWQCLVVPEDNRNPFLRLVLEERGAGMCGLE